MLSTFWSRLILLAICRHTTAIYCTNDRPVLVSGTSGIITDGSPAFQHSRAGSDCAWIITPTSTSNFTIEFSHWELNPSSDIDRIEVILVTLPAHTDGLDATRRTLTSGLAEASERVIGKVSGYIEKPLYLNRAYLDVGVGSVKTYSVLSTPDLLLQQRRRFVVPDLDPATQRIKVRFVTDPFGPQFDGFFARWWSDGYDKSSTCPFDCFEGYGRGSCSLDGVCVCGEGYSGVACHNDDKKKLMSFYSTCHGESWINSSGWNVSHPCHDVAFNEINLSAIIDWAGVGVCVANRVTSLQLPQNNLVCSADAKVPLPYFTRVLDLSGNLIQTFPAAISGLAQLSVLSLGASNISGMLSYDFFTASFPLLNLNLSSNNLGGGFYGGGWVNGLLRLDLSGNQFEGWIPVDIYMMAVPGSVWVDGNNFLCPSDAKSNGTSGALNPWTCLDGGGSFVQPTHVVMPTSLSPARIYIGGLNYVPKKIPISCVLDNGIVVAGTPVNATTVLCSLSVAAPGVHNIGLAFDYGTYPKQTLKMFQVIVTVTCPPGSYLVDDMLTGRCFPCPTGGDCPGGVLPAVSAPGYYKSPIDSLIFLECFHPEYCLGNSTCRIEATGSRCAFCADGYVNSNGRCIVCEPEQSIGVAIGFVIASILLPGWWIWRAWLGSSNAAWGVMITFFQIIGLFDKYPIYWDSRLGDVVKAVSITILNTDYINLQCAYGLGYYPRLVVVWVLPAIIAVIFKVYAVGKSMWQAKITGFLVQKHLAEWDQYAVQGFCSFLMLLHVPLTDRALRMFVCISDPNDDRYYLLGTPDISCYDDQWYMTSPFAAVFAVLYGFGIPAFFFIALFRNRSKLSDLNVRKRYSILYSSYTEDAWYWTPAQMLWSLCFMFLPVIFRRRPTYFMFISVCMMYIYLFAVVYIQPYRLKRNNHVAIFSWITIIIFLFAGIIIGFLQSGNDDNRWIIASVLVLFYTSLCIVVHAFFYEIVKGSDEASQGGHGGGFTGKLMRLLPILRLLFPIDASLQPDNTDNTQLQTDGGKSVEREEPLKTVALTRAEREMAEVSLEVSGEVQSHEPVAKELSKTKNSGFSLSWVVDSGELKEYHDEGFHAPPQNLGDSAKSLVSKGIADAKYAISEIANKISNGIQGSHQQLHDDEEHEEGHVQFVVE